ncbi:gluconokinase (plasmid) [Ketogulonicigenium robustum]|uniref:Gluconokinase n=1 Tax=Ketogulonicigenium robustum TaxID=92947 RepID=A0A1W6P352_9RHOB|nr:gluconokinase [Ketogulonicigenium robustum]ARO15874.1 gluconokinase [Ketogulonicigenium robustum]
MGAPQHIVVFGVSGVGKTTLAQQFAAASGRVFADADSFHSAANIAKMSAGTPLTDSDRAPWLAAIRDWMVANAAEGHQTVVACSALRRAYRDILGSAGDVAFAFLAGTPAMIGARMAARSGHYMPTSLLTSQFNTLEPLAADEVGLTLDASADVATLVDALQGAFAR